MREWKISFFIILTINILAIAGEKLLGIDFREAKIDSMLYLLLFLSIENYMLIRSDSE